MSNEKASIVCFEQFIEAFLTEKLTKFLIIFS